MTRQHFHRVRGLLAGALVALAATFVHAPQARAAGVVLDAHSALAPKAARALDAAIARARVRRPGAFRKIAGLPALAARLERHRRGRAIVLSPYLKALGRPALFPMLEMLAVDAPPRGPLSKRAWRDLRASVIEAVGMLRDPRAEPVLTATLEHNSEPAIVRAAAVALGRLGDDASAARLVQLATTAGPKQDAVISGLGECRRLVAARALAKLSSASSGSRELTVIRQLGNVGNSWAWQTPAVSKSGEGDAVRAVAARALVQAFVQNTGQLRTKATTEILLVDHPSTPGLIAAARRGASPALRAALDELAQRFAHDPVR